jgi:uncharacterized protein (DUF2141 family)
VKKIVLVFVALAFLMAIRPAFALVGDVNGDGKVDMRDLGIVAKAFGSHCANYQYVGEPASPNWNPLCDLNGDGKVDMRDLAIVAAHFGQ